MWTGCDKQQILNKKMEVVTPECMAEGTDKKALKASPPGSYSKGPLTAD